MRSFLLLSLIATLASPLTAGAQQWQEVALPGPVTEIPRIMDMTMDGGTVWLSTQNDGLMAFDGTLPWVLHLEDDPDDSLDCGGLQDNSWHNSILVDSAGAKWTSKDGTETVDRLSDARTFREPCDDTWTYYEQPAQFQSPRVFSMAQDGKGNMWFGIRDENLNQPSTLELLIEDDPSTTSDDEWLSYDKDDELAQFSTRDVRELAVDTEGRLWIVYYLNGVDVWSFGDYYSYEDDTIVHYGLAEGLPSDAIHGLLVATDGRVWVGANNGLAVLDAAGEAWTVADDLNVDEVTDVAEDPHGHIWAATDEGVAMLYSSGELARFYTTADGLKDNLVRMIEVDRTDGTVWAVTERMSTGETFLNRLESGFGPERDVFAYPNPWREGESSESINIQGAPEGSTVEFFDIMGQRVRKLAATREPYIWDSLDDDLNEVPSGVYVVRVETPTDGVVFTKVAIIR